MVLAAAAAFTGASVQSATGFGFALVLSPALFAVLEPFEAVWALLVLGLVLNLLVLRTARAGPGALGRPAAGADRRAAGAGRGRGGCWPWRRSRCCRWSSGSAWWPRPL